MAVPAHRGTAVRTYDYHKTTQWPVVPWEPCALHSQSRAHPRPLATGSPLRDIPTNADGGRVQGRSPTPRPSPLPQSCTVAAKRPAGACTVAALRPAGDHTDIQPTAGGRNVTSPTMCVTPLAPLPPGCATLVRPWRRGLWWIPPDLEWRQGRPCPRGARDCKVVHTYTVGKGGEFTPSCLHLVCTHCVQQRMQQQCFRGWFLNWIRHRIDVLDEEVTALAQAMGCAAACQAIRQGHL